ncbi:unnamed protein product [marine sediment metagenome]|uniref:Zinc-ribbon domain-containing protein n=1 Tax=marine sediment metagenome TaxID=412755 RepID=X0ZZ13_9ZZZZ
MTPLQNNMDELFNYINKHGFVFWTCPEGCHDIVDWNDDKTQATCRKCKTKSKRIIRKKPHDPPPKNDRST